MLPNCIICQLLTDLRLEINNIQSHCYSISKGCSNLATVTAGPTRPLCGSSTLSSQFATSCGTTTSGPSCGASSSSRSPFCCCSSSTPYLAIQSRRSSALKLQALQGFQSKHVTPFKLGDKIMETIAAMNYIRVYYIFSIICMALKTFKQSFFKRRRVT